MILLDSLFTDLDSDSLMS